MSNKPSASQSNNQIKVRFLMELSKGATVSEAAKASGKHRRTLYDWRDQDEAFRNDWDAAIKESVEVLEAEVRRRALNPQDRQSHLLLMFLLKKHDPSYRENYKKEIHVTHEKVQEIEFSKEEMDRAIDILTQQKQRAGHKTEPEHPTSE